MRSFNKILIANRGEIAIRVIKTAKELGFSTVAVYSDADKEAPHVQLADEAEYIGASPVQESYLDMQKILAAAKASGAEAVHPGYGFLSENAEFAKLCSDNNLNFIGPNALAIDLMGNKAAAKRRMIEAKVPCVPGYEGEDQSPEVMLAKANEIGFPIMVKAAAGGGGRGMRLVHQESDFLQSLSSAQSEALNAFGSDEIILEKAIMRPRHVEIQVFADKHGNVIHLGERDCSVQRRHQKVVEEAPCPVMTVELRNKMGNAAVEAAKSINYVGAGTVEFLLDESGEFYFLEMNTRLQVEHPVTEEITGLDLVAQQLKVADGQLLGLDQQDVALNGHAIEVRLYAEDPKEDFLPCTGKVEQWSVPEAPGIRVDSGITSGQEISPFYDPMIAKVIAYGKDREVARHRLIETLKKTVVFGLKTNLRYLIDILEIEAFAEGNATTAFVDEAFQDVEESTGPTYAEMAVGAVLLYTGQQKKALEKSLLTVPDLLNWSSGGQLLSRYKFSFADETHTVGVSPVSQHEFNVEIGDKRLNVNVISSEEGSSRIAVEGEVKNFQSFLNMDEKLYLSSDGEVFEFTDTFVASAAEAAAGSDGRILAPMHGTVLELFVSKGDDVAVGDRLAVLEAMKMQHDIVAEVAGTVTEIHVAAGKQASADDCMLEIEMAEDGE